MGIDTGKDRGERDDKENPDGDENENTNTQKQKIRLAGE